MYEPEELSLESKKRVMEIQNLAFGVRKSIEESV